jgi:hypothetical protein
MQCRFFANMDKINNRGLTFASHLIVSQPLQTGKNALADIVTAGCTFSIFSDVH